MKFFRIFLTLLLTLCLSCTDDYGSVSTTNAYVPETVPELSVPENIIRQGIVHLPGGSENIAIIIPVVGIKLKDGKINVNQDITVSSGVKTVDAKTDIYGPDGLIIDVSKIGGNPNLTFAGVELVTEIIPPPDLAGAILINITIKDLNSPGSVVKFSRSFRSTKIFNPFSDPCGKTPTNSLTSNTRQTVPPASAAAPVKTSADNCSSEIIKTYLSGEARPFLSGVYKAAVQKDIENSLIGKWNLSKPKFSWIGESKDTQITDPGIPPAKPVQPGTLTIFQNKEFIWQKGDDTFQGTMEQVIPNSYDDPKLTYWKIYSGKDNYYIYFKSGYVYINDQDSQLYTLIGTMAS